ncbi:MAG: hypothetical protein ACRD28_05065 [Acidobacteriaceae bacterium]
MTKTSDHVEICLFRRNELSAEADLRITVAAMSDIRHANHSFTSYEQSCRSRVVSLKGIGNNAVLCANDHGKVRTAEVTGRVRDKAFTVTITARKSIEMSADDLAEKAKMAAEQVAGALF